VNANRQVFGNEIAATEAHLPTQDGPGLVPCPNCPYSNLDHCPPGPLLSLCRMTYTPAPARNVPTPKPRKRAEKDSPDPEPGCSERRFRRCVEHYAHEHGWHCLWQEYAPQNMSSIVSGLPDLCLFRESGNEAHLLFAELKREKGGKLSKGQQLWLDRLAKVPGVEVYLWRPSDWARIKEILARSPQRDGIASGATEQPIPAEVRRETRPARATMRQEAAAL